jgi:hypothetical protein
VSRTRNACVALIPILVVVLVAVGTVLGGSGWPLLAAGVLLVYGAMGATWPEREPWR